MQLRFNGELMDFEAYSVSYGNDILDGVLLDMPENYIFLSDHSEEAREMQAQLSEEIEHFDLTGCEVDFEQPPHSWVIKSVGRMIVRTAEMLCDGE